MKTKKENKSYVYTLYENNPLPFTVGTILNLDAKKKNDKFRFTANLLGWIRPDYLLISATYDRGIMFLQIGTKIIARFLFEGQIYGFETKLVYKQSDPQPIWFLNFPNYIEVINLRDSSRYPVTCEVKDKEGIIYFTRDISEGGASLIYNKKDFRFDKNLGDNLTLNFKLPDGIDINGLNAEIVRKYSDSNQQMFGVSFNKDNIDELKKISLYISKLKDFYNYD